MLPSTGFRLRSSHSAPHGQANSIAWLVWHLTRIQDDHVADSAGLHQVWTAQGWYDQFRLPLGKEETGYGHTAKQVASIGGVSAAQLRGCCAAISTLTLSTSRPSPSCARSTKRRSTAWSTSDGRRTSPSASG